MCSCITTHFNKIMETLKSVCRQNLRCDCAYLVQLHLCLSVQRNMAFLQSPLLHFLQASSLISINNVRRNQTAVIIVQSYRKSEMSLHARSYVGICRAIQFHYCRNVQIEMHRLQTNQMKKIAFSEPVLKIKEIGPLI